jgi:HD-GYP domain-containing protein (c-di-GMP phosphodiesterase class II)
MLHLQDQLQHRREPLTQAQRDEIHQHPQRGVEMLRGAGVTDGVWLDGVLHHHESLDGSGYPGGLREGEISACAQLIHLADLYAARVSARDYRPGKPPSQALREIFLSRGQSVNATLAAVLIKELGVYPPGTFVRLANGELALAIRRGAAPDAPIVQSLVGPRGNLYVIPIRRDCGKPGLAVKEIVPQAEVDVKINRNLLWGYQPKSTRE